MDTEVKFQAGEVYELKAVRESELGLFLDAQTGNTSDDILLHKAQQTAPVKIGDLIKVYLYIDPRKRLTASMKLPKVKQGQVARVEVINKSKDGAFVDIGVHQDGLVHISQMADRFVSDPHKELHVGEKVQVTVLDVDIQRKRISLSRKTM